MNVKWQWKHEWWSIVDIAIVFVVLIVLFALNDPFISSWIVMGLAVWNYWAGGRDAQQIFQRKLAELDTFVKTHLGTEPGKFTVPLVNDMKSLEPGACFEYQVSIERNGKIERFDCVMLSAADMEFILERAGMGMGKGERVK